MSRPEKAVGLQDWHGRGEPRQRQEGQGGTAAPGKKRVLGGLSSQSVDDVPPWATKTRAPERRSPSPVPETASLAVPRTGKPCFEGELKAGGIAWTKKTAAHKTSHQPREETDGRLLNNGSRARPMARLPALLHTTACLEWSRVETPETHQLRARGGTARGTSRTRTGGADLRRKISTFGGDGADQLRGRAVVQLSSAVLLSPGVWESKSQLPPDPDTFWVERMTRLLWLCQTLPARRARQEALEGLPALTCQERPTGRCKNRDFLLH